jgi:cytochrome c553
MQDFKSGRRPATLMHQIAKGYTDAEIAELSAWLAGVKRAP